MARRVTRTGKDDDGDITRLCGQWGSVSKDMAIVEIEVSPGLYFVQDNSGKSDVVVYKVGDKKHLRTDPNGSCSDNLSSLPNC